jgi:LPXTG-motif cell wall-anchored protein
MRKHRKRQGGAWRRPGRWLRPLLALTAAAALWGGPGPAFAQSNPLPQMATAVPNAVPKAVPTAPAVAVPTPVPAPAVPVPTPVAAPTLPPVRPVAPPPVPKPVSSLPPVPPTSVPLPAAAPVATPNAQVAAPVQVPATAGVPAVGNQGAAGVLPDSSGAVASPPDIPGGAASLAGPGAALSAGPAPAPLSMGERDYSSSGSPGSASLSGGAGSAGASPAGASPALQDPGPVATICPQLAFTPLITGCQTVLAPLSGPVLSRLAHTGSPILLALAGLLLVGLGAILYRRSRPRRQDRRPGRLKGVLTR